MKRQTILCLAVVAVILQSLAFVPAEAALAYVTGVEPTTTSGTATPLFEILPGNTLTVSIQAYKFGVTDSNGRGGNIQCFMRIFKVDDFGGARTEQTDVEMAYAGDAGSGSPPSNDRYTYSFRGNDKQKYEYTLYCRDASDNTVTSPNTAEFVYGQVIFYGTRAGDVVWMSEDFSSFTGRGFERAFNLSAGQLDSDHWRVGGVVSMDFGTTRTGGVFARGETLAPSQSGVYGIKVSDTNRCLLLQPSYDPNNRVFDPGFIELRLENTLENDITPSANHSIRIQYGWYGYGNAVRMQSQFMYRISNSKNSVADSSSYTQLGNAQLTNLASGQSSMQSFDFTISPSIPFRNFAFLRWNVQSEGAITGSPDAVGLFMVKVTASFGGNPPAVITTAIPSASATAPASVSASGSVAASASSKASQTVSAASPTASGTVSRNPSASVTRTVSATPSGSAGSNDQSGGSAASTTTVTAATLLAALAAHALRLL